MSDEKQIIRVSAASGKAVKAYAEKLGIQVGEAADKLISTAASRLNALARYAKNKDPQPPGKPKKAASKTSKKVKVKKLKPKTAPADVAA